ncbi:uncharacterized protein LOC129895843 [Solanum dulcamara]|uniref:uncharacterized protein LOC129895843 n=1 Tax=Solanum dulcamara TaxID=45834 RepID=UPI0024862F34|nr:uncharacterized protein LOC129895843 [Solanum dulcamara]XP_055827598.1 uncharacterized protein LOC129895843 [Solanum dulcamara]XP_055827605.1 uncharacterized protein LOC129895843 [Solanum dulcamara]
MAGHLADEGQLPNKLKAKKSNILWSGTAWTCAKQLTHYPSFSRNGTTITVNSFAIITVEEESQYLGYLEDFYENKKGQRRVKVRRFEHFQEVKCIIPKLEGHPREVHITSHVQVIQANCIDALATVLTPGDYEKYISFVPKKLSSGVYMCYREFKNNKVAPFSLSELEGYYNQMMFTMSRSQQAQLKSKGHMLHEVKDITREDPSTQRLRGSRSVDESGHSGIRKPIPGKQIAKAKPPTCPMLNINFPSIGSVGIQLVEPQCKLSFEVGDYLEVLCQDSGMRGCWFRCKVLQVSQKRMKVQYDDIQDCDGPEKLEEWVPSYRVAASDKLGMRCTGRLTVRPRPLEDSSDIFFEVGAAVDAWWFDGWWEGVVAGFDVCGSGHHQVYFPGENMLLEIQRKNLRTSRDWIDDKWVEVKGKKDIKSFISSSLAELSKCSIKEPGNCENQMAPKLVAMKTTNCCQLLNYLLRSKTMMLLN